MRENELKPCPFCGGEAETLTAESMYGGYLFGIMCNDCRSRGDVYDTEAEAIVAWNTRYERTCRNIAEPDEMSDRPFTCSECGARGPYGEGTYHLGGCDEVDGHLCFWDSWPIYKYCPNCGAKVV